MDNNAYISQISFFMRKCQRYLLITICWLFAHGLSAQIAGSALDMMLQRPKVDKHFESKKFLDHLFLEAGVGVNTVPTVSKKTGSPSPNFEVAVGDWLTPIHGWRLGLQAGRYKYGDKNNTAFSISADYLMNISALSVPTFKDSTYKQPKSFEVYGVAGVDYYVSAKETPEKTAWGMHIGLRGQKNFSNATYAYLEGRAGIFSDNLVGIDSWRNYRLGATLMAGLGYRLTPGTNMGQYTKSGHFLDDTFISVAAGPSFFLKSDPALWKDYMGLRTSAYIGKWFNATSGVRLGAHATALKQPEHPALRAISVSAGYMWNMHNTFIGYNPTRSFWLNAVADISLNASSSKAGKDLTPGIGAGLQANFRLTKGLEFFLEPRIDVFDQKYATFTNTMSNYDMTPSLMAGLTLRQGRDTKQQLKRNDDFENAHAFDNLFIEGSLGLGKIVTAYNVKHPNSNLRPQARIGVGKWFSATSGVRIWADAAQYQINGERPKAFTAGADYIWNITNAFHGYVPERRFEIIGALGLNTSLRSGSSRLFFGGNAGLKGLWNINSAYGLFIEPQLRLFGNDYMAKSSTPLLNMDLMASAHIGMQIKLAGYQPHAANEEFEANDRRAFFSVAGGVYTSASDFDNKRAYGVAGRLSYGSWFSPISAWRLSFNGYGNPRVGYRYAQMAVGGDYISDLSALAWGYNTERRLILRGLLGYNLGVDYKAGDKARFHSDIHVGGQLACRVSSTNELFLEPRLSYALHSRNGARWQRIKPSLVLGITHNMKSTKIKDGAAPEQSQFVSAAIGTGLHTSTVTSMSPVSRKFTFDTRLAYGRWLSSAQGFRVGLSNAHVRRHGSNQNITSLSADYMLDILSANDNTRTKTEGFQLAGFIGANLNLGTRHKHSPTWSPGLQMSLQPSYKFNKNWGAYLEAQGIMTTKNIVRHNTHPVAGQFRLMIGTTYCF